MKGLSYCVTIIGRGPALGHRNARSTAVPTVLVDLLGGHP